MARTVRRTVTKVKRFWRFVEKYVRNIMFGKRTIVLSCKRQASLCLKDGVSCCCATILRPVDGVWRCCAAISCRVDGVSCCYAAILRPVDGVSCFQAVIFNCAAKPSYLVNRVTY